jgi:hypothetical protein
MYIHVGVNIYIYINIYTEGMGGRKIGRYLTSSRTGATYIGKGGT